MPQIDPNTPLSDDYLKAHADDPEIAPYFSSDERRRLTRLKSTPAAAPSQSIPRDATGKPLRDVIGDGNGEPSQLLEMLRPLAHPETFTDFARLLTLPVDAMRRTAAGALTAAAGRPAVEAVKGAPAAAGRAAVNGTAAVGDVIDPSVIGTVSPRAGKVVELAQRVRDARAAAAQAAAPATEAAPVAQTATEAAPVARAASNALPNQKLLNELAIAARRAKVTLTPETEAAAIKAVESGASPMEAVAKVGGAARVEAQAATAAVKSAPAMTKQVGGVKLSAPEWKEFQRMLGRGKTTQQALEAVQTARELAQKLGGATPSEVAKAVAHRNQTGSW